MAALVAVRFAKPEPTSACWPIAAAPDMCDGTSAVGDAIPGASVGQPTEPLNLAVGLVVVIAMAAALAPSLLPTGDRISGGGPKRRGQAPLINQINCVGKSAAVTISKRLGHSSPDVTLRIYAHLFHKDDRKAAAAINAGLGQ